MSHLKVAYSRAVAFPGTTFLLLTGSAMAQDPPATPQRAEPLETAVETPVATAPTEVAPAATEAAPANAPEADALSFGLFADAYWGYQTARAGTPAPSHRAYAWRSPAGTNENGFSLSFLGVDASYDIGEAAATGSLRFGPSVPEYYAGDAGPLGIDSITQAFVTWRPVETLSIDLGQFGTIFGAEVAESWINLNYSRGGLYYAMQPFWHTGLRAAYTVSNAVTVKALVVNGANNISEDRALGTDDNDSPSAGLQAVITPTDEVSVAAGGLLAFDAETDSSGFERYLDLVATMRVQDLTVIFNCDYNMNVEENSDDNTSFYGLSLGAGYSFTDMFGLAVRGEYLSDNDNALYARLDPNETKVAIVTGTLTLDLKPIPGHDNLVIRWDNRLEGSSASVYFGGDPADPTVDPVTGEETPPLGNASIWFGSVVGAVVHTN